MERFHVECEPDARGASVPARFGVPGALRAVAEVVDRWDATDHSYFRVRTQDGATCILRHDHGRGTWQLAFFQRAARAVPWPRAVPARPATHARSAAKGPKGRLA